jgi:hypothetical protein
MTRRRGGEGEGGNREVPPLVVSGARGDLSGAGVGACLKEGGTWGKHGFPHASEPQAREVVCMVVAGQKAA